MRRGDSLEDDTAIGTLDTMESLYSWATTQQGRFRNRDEHGRRRGKIPLIQGVQDHRGGSEEVGVPEYKGNRWNGK